MIALPTFPEGEDEATSECCLVSIFQFPKDLGALACPLVSGGSYPIYLWTRKLEFRVVKSMLGTLLLWCSALDFPSKCSAFLRGLFHHSLIVYTTENL